tara:strand:- start:159 stop:338 length:180 start_codon:yes stop_codon:yes gene_type:complete
MPIEAIISPISLTGDIISIKIPIAITNKLIFFNIMAPYLKIKNILNLPYLGLALILLYN